MNRGRRSVVAAGLGLCLLGLSLAGAWPAGAALNIFLKIDGIPGESHDEKHKGEIDVLAWSWAVEVPASISYGGGAAAAPKYSPLVVKKSVDKASPSLFLSAAKGDHIKSAVLTVRALGGNQLEFYKITLGDVLVASVAEGGAGNTLPAEEIALDYGTLSYFYTPTGSGIEPPQVVYPGTQTSAEGDTVALQITTVAPYVESVTFSALGLPPGLAISPTTGLITGTLPYDAAGAYGVTIYATDPGGLRGATRFTWIVTNTNRAPQIAGVDNQANLEGDAVSLQAVASDPDGDALAYAATGLPPGLTLDPSTGLISGAISPLAAGTYSVTVTVSDPGALTASAGFTWTVTLGQPRISGVVASKGWMSSPGVMFVDVTLKNTGTGHARNAFVKTVVPRTLMGTGVITYDASISPALPLPVGDLNVGASTTVRFYFNIPATVTRFSITEGGSVQDVRGTIFNYSTGQALIP